MFVQTRNAHVKHMPVVPVNKVEARAVLCDPEEMGWSVSTAFGRKILLPK